MPLKDSEVDLDFRNDTLGDLEGEPLLPEGRYHVVITSAKREAAESGSTCFRVRYRVVAGTNPAAKGATASERFYLSQGALKRLKILAHRLGLAKDEDIGVKAGPMNFEPAIGRELVV